MTEIEDCTCALLDSIYILIYIERKIATHRPGHARCLLYTDSMTKNTPSLPISLHRSALIFTGHMIDEPARLIPRFPHAMEKLAAKAIRQVVAAMQVQSGNSLMGIASGARGGDILFHEACSALGVPTIMVLPFAAEPFLNRSVRGVSAGDWEARFKKLWENAPSVRRVVLSSKTESDPFGACNRTMLDVARAHGQNVHLLALWDGSSLDKLGGTAAFVAHVKAAGGAISRIDTGSLLEELRAPHASSPRY